MFTFSILVPFAKLYIADMGLFITLMFIDRPVAENEIYAKLLSDNHTI